MYIRDEKKHNHKFHNEIQLTKKENELEQSKIKNHPLSPKQRVCSPAK